MPKQRDQARLPADDRRDQILRVATIHFGRDQDNAVSIRQIADDAGVTRALVYHYFPGKDALLAAVLQREAEALLAATEPDPALTPADNLHRALTAYLDHFTASSGQLRDLYAPAASSAPIVHELSRSNHAVQVERVVTALGVPDSPVNRLAVTGWLGFIEEAATAAEHTNDVTRDDVMTLCGNVLMSVVGGDLVAEMSSGPHIQSQEKINRKRKSP